MACRIAEDVSVRKLYTERDLFFFRSFSFAKSRTKHLWKDDFLFFIQRTWSGVFVSRLLGRPQHKGSALVSGLSQSTDCWAQGPGSDWRGSQTDPLCLHDPTGTMERVMGRYGPPRGRQIWGRPLSHMIWLIRSGVLKLLGLVGQNIIWVVGSGLNK